MICWCCTCKFNVTNSSIFKLNIYLKNDKSPLKLQVGVLVMCAKHLPSGEMGYSTPNSCLECTQYRLIILMYSVTLQLLLILHEKYYFPLMCVNTTKNVLQFNNRTKTKADNCAIPYQDPQRLGQNWAYDIPLQPQSLE